MTASCSTTGETIQVEGYETTLMPLSVLTLTPMSGSADGLADLRRTA